MKIHELNVKAHKDSKRVGRGIGSGYGKTAGRGTKGQNARTGGGVRIGFEGGQNPLAKRLPKIRGFKALSHIDFQEINLNDLARLKAGSTTDTPALAKLGLVASSKKPVKILGTGEVSRAVTLQIQGATRTARAAVEAAGGKIEIVPLPKASKAEPAEA